MPRSADKINFRVRSAKHVERRMFCELFAELRYFAPLRDFRYVGMGGYDFRDFRLFHKQLGINRMVDIEKADSEAQKERKKLNKPFGCVDLKFGRSTDVLPELDWSSQTIAWLDYDFSLNASALQDCATFASRALRGSVYLATLDVEPEALWDPPYTGLERDTDEEEVAEGETTLTASIDPSREIPQNAGEQSRLEMLKFRLSESSEAADGLQAKDLATPVKIAEAFGRLLFDRIRSSLAARNVAKKPGEEDLEFTKLVEVYYKDGRPMCTFGGVIHYANAEDRKQIGSWTEGRPWLKSAQDGKVFKISIPPLTAVEMRKLEQHLPGNLSEIADPFLSDEEMKGLDATYRFLPFFADADI